MNRRPDELGYREGIFNRCNFAPGSQCPDNYLVVIHYQLLCRKSAGTVDTVESHELYPVRSNRIAYKLGSATGATRTDDAGYGQVELIRARSSAYERLRLTIDDRFVATPAAETARIVVPENWCEQH